MVLSIPLKKLKQKPTLMRYQKLKQNVQHVLALCALLTRLILKGLILQTFVWCLCMCVLCLWSDWFCGLTWQKFGICMRRVKGLILQTFVSDVCACVFYVCEMIGFVDWLDKSLIYIIYMYEKSFEMCICLWPEFECPEVTLCGWH